MSFVNSRSTKDADSLQKKLTRHQRRQNDEPDDTLQNTTHKKVRQGELSKLLTDSSTKEDL